MGEPDHGQAVAVFARVQAMKGWRECGRCWGSGFVAGIGAPCDELPPTLTLLALDALLSADAEQLRRALDALARAIAQLAVQSAVSEVLERHGR